MEGCIFVQQKNLKKRMANTILLLLWLSIIFFTLVFTMLPSISGNKFRFIVSIASMVFLLPITFLVRMKLQLDGVIPKCKYFIDLRTHKIIIIIENWEIQVSREFPSSQLHIIYADAEIFLAGIFLTLTAYLLYYLKDLKRIPLNKSGPYLYNILLLEHSCICFSLTTHMITFLLFYELILIVLAAHLEWKAKFINSNKIKIWFLFIYVILICVSPFFAVILIYFDTGSWFFLIHGHLTSKFFNLPFALQPLLSILFWGGLLQQSILLCCVVLWQMKKKHGVVGPVMVLVVVSFVVVFSYCKAIALFPYVYITMRWLQWSICGYFTTAALICYIRFLIEVKYTYWKIEAKFF